MLRHAPPYAAWAPYYDAIYEPVVDYDGDVAFILEAFDRHARGRLHRVLDLGCGTGGHAVRLAQQGKEVGGREGPQLEVEGVDRSEDLLEVAREKARRAGVGDRVRFYQSDFAESLPDGPFDAAISMFGAFNYLVDDAHAARHVDLVAERVRPGGLFAFEFWRPGGVRAGYRDWLSRDVGEGRTLYRLSESAYDAAGRVVTITFDVLILEGERVAARWREEHALRARTRDEVRALLEPRGFEVRAFTQAEREEKAFEAPAEDALRVMCIARRVEA